MRYKCLMNAQRLKAWMERAGKKPVDVASAAGVSEATVKRYLKGSTVHSFVEAAFSKVVMAPQETKPDSDEPPKGAA